MDAPVEASVVEIPQLTSRSIWYVKLASMPDEWDILKGSSMSEASVAPPDPEVPVSSPPSVTSTVYSSVFLNVPVLVIPPPVVPVVHTQVLLVSQVVATSVLFTVSVATVPREVSVPQFAVPSVRTKIAAAAGTRTSGVAPRVVRHQVVFRQIFTFVLKGEGRM